MQYKNTYTLNYRITDSDVDFLGKLKFSKISSLFQDAAALHTIELDCERNEILPKYNVVWIIMRLRVDVVRRPSLFEKIKIETWPVKPKLRHERDFFVRDENDEVIMTGSTTWILMDIEAKDISKLILPYTEVVDFREDRAISEKLSNIRMPKDMKKLQSRKIYASDIDVNLHLNNTVYPDIILDSLGLKFQRENEIKTLEIGFQNEIKLDDELILYRGNSDKDLDNHNEIFIQGMIENIDENGSKKDNEKIAFKAKIIVR